MGQAGDLNRRQLKRDSPPRPLLAKGRCERAHLWWTYVKTNREEANKGPMEKWSKFKKLFLEHFLPRDHIQKMKKRLKNLRQGTLLVHKYKYRFDELVEYFSDFSDKDLKILFITGL
jgi:hypothetical protein